MSREQLDAVTPLVSRPRGTHPGGRRARIDHITVYARAGFDREEVAALDRLRRLSVGEAEWQLMLVGFGSPADFRCPLFATSSTWTSATPFVVTRQVKTRGRKKDDAVYRRRDTGADFAALVLGEELRRPEAGLPAVVSIDRLDTIKSGPGEWRALQFQRFRRKRGDDGGRRPFGLFRITFAEPIRGPLCLGYSSHFGLGLFRPATST